MSEIEPNTNLASSINQAAVPSQTSPRVQANSSPKDEINTKTESIEIVEPERLEATNANNNEAAYVAEENAADVNASGLNSLEAKASQTTGVRASAESSAESNVSKDAERIASVTAVQVLSDLEPPGHAVEEFNTLGRTEQNSETLVTDVNRQVSNKTHEATLRSSSVESGHILQEREDEQHQIHGGTKINLLKEVRARQQQLQEQLEEAASLAAAASSTGTVMPTVSESLNTLQHSAQRRRRRNLCVCEQASSSVFESGQCRILEDRAGSDHWLNSSSFQLPPPGAERCGIKLRERWLAHLGITEDQLSVKCISKPEVCWTHFPEVFFKMDGLDRRKSTNSHGDTTSNENPPSSSSRNRRRRLRFAVLETSMHHPEDIIKDGKHVGFAIPVPCVKFDINTPIPGHQDVLNVAMNIADQRIDDLHLTRPAKVPRLENSDFHVANDQSLSSVELGLKNSASNLKSTTSKEITLSHTGTERTSNGGNYRSTSLLSTSEESGAGIHDPYSSRVGRGVLHDEDLHNRLQTTLLHTETSNRAMQTYFQDLVSSIRELAASQYADPRLEVITSRASKMRSLYFSTVHELQTDISILHKRTGLTDLTDPSQDP